MLIRALRWVGDYGRGYQRTADARERVHSLIERAAAAPEPSEWTGAALYALTEIASSRNVPGPLGAGARLGCTGDELQALLERARELRAEAPLYVSTRPHGDA